MNALFLAILIFALLLAICGVINEVIYRAQARLERRPDLWSHKGKGGQP